MASGLITRFLGEGLAASRPADPDIGSAIGFYWSTDTNELSAWLENAWVENLLGSPTGAFALLGDISPSQITSDQDNYNPTNLSTASTLRLSSDASRNITGLQGGSDGRILFVHNVGSFNIVLKDESASSTAGNRFALTADVTLSPDSVAVLQYDSTSSRWRCVSGGGSGGSFTTASTTEVLTGTDTAKGATPDAIAALWEQGSDVASAATVSLGEGGYFNITGTTTITDIDFATDKAGRHAWVKFAGALTLTHNASTLILPGGANITTAAGDTACFVSEGSDVVRCVSYNKASGRAVVTSGAWQLLGGAYAAAGKWDNAVDGAVSNIDFTGLSGVDEIRILMDDVTKSVTGVPNLYVSVDNGSTWYTTSGDYVFMGTNGAITNSSAMAQGHITNATAARSCIMEVWNARTGLPVGQSTIIYASPRFFKASSSPINAVRISPSGGGTFNGGRCFCVVR